MSRKAWEGPGRFGKHQEGQGKPRRAQKPKEDLGRFREGPRRPRKVQGKVQEGPGRPWKVQEGPGRSWKA